MDSLKALNDNAPNDNAPNDNAPNDNAPNDNAPNANGSNSNAPNNEASPQEVPYDQATDTTFFRLLYALDTVWLDNRFCSGHKKFILRFILYGSECPGAIPLKETFQYLGLLSDPITPSRFRLQSIQTTIPPLTRGMQPLSIQTTQFPIFRNMRSVAWERFVDRWKDWETMVEETKKSLESISAHTSDLYKKKKHLALNIVRFSVDGQYDLIHLCGQRSFKVFLLGVRGMLDRYFYTVCFPRDSLFPEDWKCNCLFTQTLGHHIKEFEMRVDDAERYGASLLSQQQRSHTAVQLVLTSATAGLIFPPIREILLKPGRFDTSIFEGDAIDRLVEVWDRPDVQQELEDLRNKSLEETRAKMKKNEVCPKSDLVPDQPGFGDLEHFYAIDMLWSVVQEFEPPGTSEETRITTRIEWLARVLQYLTVIDVVGPSNEGLKIEERDRRQLADEWWAKVKKGWEYASGGAERMVLKWREAEKQWAEASERRQYTEVLKGWAKEKSTSQKYLEVADKLVQKARGSIHARLQEIRRRTDAPEKDWICHFCHKTGHCEADCYLKFPFCT